MLAHALLGLLLSLLIIHPAFWLKLKNAESLRNTIVTAWFRWLARILRLRPRVVGEPAAAPALVVANHVSWVDIISLAQVLPGSFVAKAEIARWPLVGWLCMAADTLFIKRGDRHSAERIGQEIAAKLDQGRRVFIFPEGTSTDGSLVKPFRRRLYRPASLSHVPVQAVALLYPAPDGKIDPAILYTGNDTFPQSLGRVLGAPCFDLEIIFCPALNPDEFAPEYVDHQLALKTREQVWAAVRQGYPALAGQAGPPAATEN